MRVYQFRHIRATVNSSRGTPAGILHGNRQSTFGVKPTMTRIFGLTCALALCCLPAASAAREATHVGGAARGGSRGRRHARPRRRSPGARGAAARAAVDREQARFAAALRSTIPDRPIRWRYRIVLNGAAVVVPARRRLHAPVASRREVGRLEHRLPGLHHDGRTDMATAARTWQTGLANQGDGIKIGIIDDGVDQTHRYFSPAGYTMPPGFPKGQAAYTTAKVIVARAFAPRRNDLEVRRQAVRPGRVRARDARRRHRRRKRGHRDREHDGLGSRPARVPRQLQGAQRPDARRRPRRQRRRDRGRDRGRREGRHGRDQPLDRRARGRAVARPRRARDRRRRRRGRDPRDRRRERLRRLRPRLGRLAGNGRPRDHGGCGDEPECGGPFDLAGFCERRPDGALAAAEARHQRAGRLDPLVRTRAGGRRCPARPWRRPRSPARRRSSASGTRTGRWRRSRRL